MATVLERYAEILASNGREATAHEARVAEVIGSFPGTFAEEDVVEPLRGQVSRATVYRGIARMLVADLLRRVRFNDRDVYVVTPEQGP